MTFLVLASLSAIGTGCFFPFWSDPPTGPSLLYVLPQGFSGWSCVDFGVVGAPPLEQEDSAFVIRPKRDEILETSQSSNDLLFATTWQVFEEVAGVRRKLPIDVLRTTSTETDTNDPVARHCVFFGTGDERDGAGDAPKLIRGLDGSGSCAVPKD